MATDIDIDLLRAFLAVADSGSFTSAARALNRTQSAVSTQIKRLEGIAHGTLFERNSRRVVLTRHGEALCSYARRMIALNDEALKHLCQETLAGVVRLGAIEDYAAYTLPPILAGFMAAHPNVAIETETGFTSSLIKRLGETFDLVLAMHPDGSGQGEVVRLERAVWIGSRQHRVYEHPLLPLALHPPECQFRQAALAALDGAKRSWRLVYVSQSLGAIEGAAFAGLAVTVTKTGTLPKGLAALGPAEGLPALPNFEISLHRGPHSNNHAATALADYLVASLRDGSAEQNRRRSTMAR
jgi:DNA-binding transcriptional LysR family regulator